VPLVQGIGRAFREGLQDPAFRALLAILVSLLAAGTIAFHLVEGWDWLDSLYFCVITMATVGYGDFHPVTPLGKILAMLFIVVGLGVLVGFAQQLLTHLVADIQANPIRGMGRHAADAGREAQALPEEPSPQNDSGPRTTPRPPDEA
jgi:hypothetical protein